MRTAALTLRIKKYISNNKIIRGKFMGVGQIVKSVGVLVAVIAGLMGGFPESALVIAVLGAVGGYFIEEDDASRFLIVALALIAVNGALGDIPAVGGYITSALASVSSLFNAGAVTVIVVGVAKKLMP